MTPYTPLALEQPESETTLKAGEVAKVQLGAQIDGFGTIVCDMVVVGKDVVTGREADLIHATYYANELLLRLMVPPGLLASGTEEEKKKAAAEKAPSQAHISKLVEKVAKSFDTTVVENTTSWQFEHNEIEAAKKIILIPGSGVRGEGVPDVGEVWGVEMGLSLGSGKVKNLPLRPTLHRRTTTTYQLKRPSSRETLSEIVKRFGHFPFSLRQLSNEKSAKVGVVESVRGEVLRQYEPAGDSENAPVSRLLTTIGKLQHERCCDTTNRCSDHQERDHQAGDTGRAGSVQVQDGQEDRGRGDPRDPAASAGPIDRIEEQQEQEEEEHQQVRQG